MKVLHITEALGGGVQSAIRLYTEATPHLTHFVLGRKRANEDTGEFSSVSGVQLVPGSKIRFLSTVRQHVRRIDPDVIHLHSSIAGIARVVRLGGRPVVYSPHCFAFERTDLPRVARAIIRLIERALVTRTDCIFGVSPHEVLLAKQLGADSAILVPNFVAGGKSYDRQSGSGTRVISTGRIGAQKDPAMYAEIARRLPHLQFFWLGDGEPELKARLQGAGVHCPGWCSREDVDHHLRGADLYLHTGAWEAAPIAVAEAVATGLPVLSRSIESMASLGYSLAGSTPGEIAQTVDLFFRSPELRSSTISATRQIAERYEGSKMAETLSGGYRLAQDKRGKFK
ncbi:glycosyltransferase [Arthrobacter sp. NPDC092385]|uniref:glycosyltransferase n=1 Tax=Arthrobacter sp. NPDC092385 TaxID=3363943 RepID=UPI00380832E6